jgi:hypothetical protein
MTRSPDLDKSEIELTSNSSSAANGAFQVPEPSNVLIPSTQLQQLIDTNTSLRESNQQIKHVLIQISALLSDSSRFTSYPSSRTPTFSTLFNKSRRSEDSTESDGWSGLQSQDALRHALDTDSVRQMILQAPASEENDNLSSMSTREIQKENAEFREIYRCMPGLPFVQYIG